MVTRSRIYKRRPIFRDQSILHLDIFFDPYYYEPEEKPKEDPQPLSK